MARQVFSALARGGVAAVLGLAIAARLWFGAATDADFQGADFTTGMLDSVSFTRTNLSNALQVDTIFLRATFDDIHNTGADFSGAILDSAQARKLCQRAAGKNSNTQVANRNSPGCGLGYRSGCEVSTRAAIATKNPT